MKNLDWICLNSWSSMSSEPDFYTKFLRFFKGVYDNKIYDLPDSAFYTPY
jgi:hypothetical protein